MLAMIHTWPYSLMAERRPSTVYFYTTVEALEDEPTSPLLPSSWLGDINRAMTNMHQRFEHMFNWPTFPTDFHDMDYDYLDGQDPFPMSEIYSSPVERGVVDIEKRLEAVQPVCTTTINGPTTISPRKSRRKKLSSTQTTKCVKELIINGQKHFSEEITTTDDKGAVVKQDKRTGTVSLDTKPTEQ